MISGQNQSGRWFMIYIRSVTRRDQPVRHKSVCDAVPQLGLALSTSPLCLEGQGPRRVVGAVIWTRRPWSGPGSPHPGTLHAKNQNNRDLIWAAPTLVSNVDEFSLAQKSTTRCRHDRQPGS
jgi:hypothetical protein